MAVILNKTYRIKSYAGNGRNLNVYGNEQVSNNRNVCLWSQDSTANAQKWTLKKSSTGYNKLVTALNNSYALNYNCANGLGNAGNCDIYPEANNDTYSAISFNTVDAANNVYKIKLRNYSLYLTAASNSDGANVTWEASNGTTAQQWKLVEVDETEESDNFATYPCSAMNITQKYNGTTSHLSHSNGIPCDYPTDEACENTGRSWMYCPCDEMEIIRIYGVGESDKTNTIWLKSTSKVKMPYGEDYLVMMVIHPEDDDLSQLSVGQKFTRGTAMFREGKEGNASGYHFHISVGTGDGITGTGWIKNNLGEWVLTPVGETIKIEDAFYLDTSFTTVINNQGITFTNKP